MAAGFYLEPATSGRNLADATTLYREYAASLPIDLTFQEFEEEVRSLPGQYAPPAGTIIIARDRERHAIGCVAVRPMPAPGACEMKRLYVAPNGRGFGIGVALVEAGITAARDAGYRAMFLDTLATMTEAQRLYRRFQFAPVEPYHSAVVDGMLFFRRDL